MVTISREAAECAATALRKINEEDYYSNNGKAQREIEMALKSVKYNYDPKCWDLAGHFLSETVCKDTDREELAQDIQDAVESWFGEWERKIASPPAEAPEPCKTCGGKRFIPGSSTAFPRACPDCGAGRASGGE